MSKEFFKALEESLQQAIEMTYEFRLYYKKDGSTYDKANVLETQSDEREYIVITSDQYDGINYTRHFVVDGELQWIKPKEQHWYLTQSELTTNPYIKE